MSKRIERVGQRAFVEAFAVARGRRSLRKAIPDAAQYRLLDPNTTDAERALLHRLLGQSGEI